MREIGPVMSDDNEAHRRKRLLYQSKHRGTKEADLILGGFVHAHMASLTVEQFTQLEALLEESDPDLMGWISGQITPPAVHDNEILKMICNFKYTF
ncbi:succinate dehydrogenase assembly factor 2 [Alphaproteobacteria bacterium]|nr:succinate dehydrogenase assembly factor 2 [Alphaproteobacteria bacterium]